MLSDWIQAGATIILAIITFFYMIFTKSLAQTGSDPIVEIVPCNPSKNLQLSVINILCEINIVNKSNFIAKDMQVTIIRNDKTKLEFTGHNILFPQKMNIYSAEEEPCIKPFEPNDKLIISFQNIMGRKITCTYYWELTKRHLDRDMPAQFNLKDIKAKTKLF